VAGAKNKKQRNAARKAERAERAGDSIIKRLGVNHSVAKARYPDLAHLLDDTLYESAYDIFVLTALMCTEPGLWIPVHELTEDFDFPPYDDRNDPYTIDELGHKVALEGYAIVSWNVDNAPTFANSERIDEQSWFLSLHRMPSQAHAFLAAAINPVVVEGPAPTSFFLTQQDLGRFVYEDEVEQMTVERATALCLAWFTLGNLPLGNAVFTETSDAWERVVRTPGLYTGGRWPGEADLAQVLALDGWVWAQPPGEFDLDSVPEHHAAAIRTYQLLDLALTTEESVERFSNVADRHKQSDSPTSRGVLLERFAHLERILRERPGQYSSTQQEAALKWIVNLDAEAALQLAVASEA